MWIYSLKTIKYEVWNVRKTTVFSLIPYCIFPFKTMYRASVRLLRRLNSSLISISGYVLMIISLSPSPPIEAVRRKVPLELMTLQGPHALSKTLTSLQTAEHRVCELVASGLSRPDQTQWLGTSTHQQPCMTPIKSEGTAEILRWIPFYSSIISTIMTGI